MRRASAAVLVSAMSSTLLVLPAVTVPAAAARPVSPRVESLPLVGLDPAGLAESPAPRHEPGEDGGRHEGVADDETAPLAVTGKVRTGPFSAVGVTWARHAAVDDVAVQVRTRTQDRWSNWTEIEVQLNGPADAHTGEANVPRQGSDPLYVGPSDAVQVRVDAGKVKPRDLQLVLIDPGTSGADEGAAAGRAISAPWVARRPTPPRRNRAM